MVAVKVLALLGLAVLAAQASAFLHQTARLQVHRRQQSVRVQSIAAPSLPPSSSDPSSVAPFEQLQRMDERIRILKEQEIEYLSGFWNPELSCFSITPTAQVRVSITSTSFCMFAILDNTESWNGIAGYDVSHKINMREVRDALIQAPWSFDPFQTPIVFSVLAKLRGSPLARAKFRRGLETLLTFRPTRSQGPYQQYSAYVHYWTAHALWQLLSDPETADILEGTNRLQTIQEHVLETQAVASDEVCRQLAYFSAGDTGMFDVIKLAYSLCTYYETSEKAAPYVTREGLSSNATRLSMKLVEDSLKVIFSQMADDGLWRKGEPIYSAHGEMNGRDIGNAYVFAYDMLGTILHVFEDEPTLFVPYVPQLEKLLKWAEDNVLVDVVSPGHHGRVLKGWRSNHLRNEGKKGPVAWCTAQTFIGLARMRKVVKALLAKDILIEFGGLEVGSSNPNSWTRLLDSNLLLNGKSASLKETIEKRFLEPLVNKEASLSSTPSSTPAGFHKKLAPLYSGILFGPPGTAKTSIVTSIAYYLGWNFVTIDTADFLAYGLQNIASRMTYVFDRLKMLEKTVILFDEIEEFCLDREDKSLSMESRMLTTAMLTQLNDLRRKQKCLFFIATNRLRSFDAAVIRPGRFDAIVFVGTPNLEARFRRFHDLLSQNGVDGAAIKQYESVVKPFLAEKWEEHLQFFNFAENEALTLAIIELCLSGELSVPALEEILENAARVVTIRGGIREEYIESIQLSRF